MRFSIAIPTCVEGLLFPVPFVTPERLMRVATAAESLGYHSVWGNDHLTTQNYVKAAWDDPPTYYEPLVALSFAANATSRIGLGTSIIVMPMREPVLLAKQVATLDRFSGGRMLLGLGVGAYREEFEAVRAGISQAHRGTMLEEGIQALQTLFRDRVASFEGDYYHFEEVESYPKPEQTPLPIYVGGNAVQAAERAGRWGQGWLPAVLPPDQLKQRLGRLYQVAEEAGRDPTAIDIAPQFSVSIDRSHEEAVNRFRNSQLYHHLMSLKESTLREVDLSAVETLNLIGTPDEISEKIRAFGEIGVTHFCSLIFGSESINEAVEQMQFFSEEVMSQFTD